MKTINKHFRLRLKTLSLLTLLLAVGSLLSLSLLKQDKNTLALDSDISNGITVDSTLDTQDSNIGDTICDDGAGDCTLRAAIQEANSNPDASTIEFNIAPLDGGVKTIAPASGLPAITAPVTIDGFTQDNATPNSVVFPDPLDTVLRIELSGENLGVNLASGISFLDGSDGSSIKGLAINRFTSHAIFVNPGADYVKIKGNYIGTDTTGLIARKNKGTGVSMSGTTFYTGGPDYGEIGGPNPEDRNILSANDTDSNDPNLVIGSQGVAVLSGSDHWYLKGNYIGVASDGATPLPNELGGITADYIEDLTIGGDQPGEGNIFSGNGDGGIQPDGVIGLTVQGNYIGTDYTGLNPVPNGTKGMTLAYGTENALVGGTTAGAANIIAFNPWFGVNVWQAETQNVSVIGNSIHSNGNGLGIDLSNQNDNSDVSPNDPLDSDAGANDLLNFPLYTNIQEVSGDTEVDYLLDVPAGDYRIEFFSNTTPDPSGYGEGEEYLGFTNVTSTGSGEQSFSYTLTGVTGVTNLAMTTTEIDESADGFGATSEFGGYQPPPPPVSDISITKTLTNPQDIAIGANANYQITYINNGPNNADLSGFSTFMGGNPLIMDLVPADLINPSGYLSDGPFPGSQIIDVGNPDLTCLYGPGPSASMFGATTDTSVGLVICWLTGPDTTLESGSSITAELNFEVAPDSDLAFTNYAIGSPISSDPDVDAVSTVYGSGDLLAGIISLQSPINNFAAAAFPLPFGSEDLPVNSTSNGGLGQTGSSVAILSLVAVLLVSMSAVGFAKRNYYRARS